MSTNLDAIYVYFSGQQQISFERAGPRDWYAYDVHAQRRIVSFGTRRELIEARSRLANCAPTTRSGMVDGLTAYEALRGQL